MRQFFKTHLKKAGKFKKTKLWSLLAGLRPLKTAGAIPERLKEGLRRLALFGRQRPRIGQRRGRRAGQRGQGLIEYLILVALMGVATIGIIRTLNQTVKSRFANAIYALQGRKQKAKTHQLKKEEYQRSDLSNFMTGAASADDKKRKSKK